MALYMNAVRANKDNPELKLPAQSLTKAMMQLRSILVLRLAKRNIRMTRPIAKKQRDLLTLLGLPIPPSLLDH